MHFNKQFLVLFFLYKLEKFSLCHEFILAGILSKPSTIEQMYLAPISYV